MSKSTWNDVFRVSANSSKIMRKLLFSMEKENIMETFQFFMFFHNLHITTKFQFSLNSFAYLLNHYIEIYVNCTENGKLMSFLEVRLTERKGLQCVWNSTRLVISFEFQKYAIISTKNIEFQPLWNLEYFWRFFKTQCFLKRNKFNRKSRRNIELFKCLSK